MNRVGRSGDQHRAPLRLMTPATGLSAAHCSFVRCGLRVPHRRQWQGLDVLGNQGFTTAFGRRALYARAVPRCEPVDPARRGRRDSIPASGSGLVAGPRTGHATTGAAGRVAPALPVITVLVGRAVGGVDAGRVDALPVLADHAADAAVVVAAQLARADARPVLAELVVGALGIVEAGGIVAPPVPADLIARTGAVVATPRAVTAALPVLLTDLVGRAVVTT
jgi:hypothetical protein